MSIVVPKYDVDGGKLRESVAVIDKEIIVKDAAISLEMSSGPWNNNQKFFDRGNTLEHSFIDKYNFVSWEGFLIRKPYFSVLYEGILIRFKDEAELSRFCNTRFRKRKDDVCIICGEKKGKHLRYTLAMGIGLPYNLFLCSKECLSELTHNIGHYRKIIEELKLPVTHGSEFYPKMF